MVLIGDLSMQDLEREKIGKKASIVAISGNIFLTVFNLLVGFISGSTALVAEGAHTLSDVITSLLAYIGFRIGMKPADKEHPYGHGRAEPVVGLVIVGFLVIVAYEILLEAYKKIVEGAATTPDITAALMALIGIFVNYIMTIYLIRSGKKINSPVLIADGHHQSVDIFSCAAVIIGVVGAQFGFRFLDPIVAVVITILILRTAGIIAKDNVDAIMGKIPSKMVEDIKLAVLSLETVKGVHDVKINNMGPYACAELHIELDKNLKLEETHKIAHQVEKLIIEDISPIKMVMVHTCPYEEDCDI